jgi:hypothetical protein
MTWKPTSFHTIYESLSKLPGLTESIGVEEVIRFIRLLASLKCEIEHHRWPGASESHIPDDLPAHIRTFLALGLGVSDESVDVCWHAFKWNIWYYDQNEHLIVSDSQLFRDHAVGLDISTPFSTFHVK